MGRKHRYWLMKSEPDCFSIYDLKNSSGHTTCWDGVRNYQARNYLRCMKAGDRVLFYHSNADPPSVVGEAEVVREAYPDARTGITIRKVNPIPLYGIWSIFDW